MPNWLIKRDVELTDAENAVWRVEALQVVGDQGAHTWRIRVLDGGIPSVLTGYSATAYFIRADGGTVTVPGIVSGNEVSAVLPQACYAVPGPLIGIMRLLKPGSVTSLGRMYTRVLDGISGILIDPGQVVPDINALLAMIAEMEAKTAAANTAANNANTATSSANQATSNANTAANNANTAANRLSSVGMTVEMLAPSASPTAQVTQTATKTTFALGIPKSNVAMATFEVDVPTMALMMTTPEGFAGIGFALNNNGELEVTI